MGVVEGGYQFRVGGRGSCYCVVCLFSLGGECVGGVGAFQDLVLG